MTIRALGIAGLLAFLAAPVAAQQPIPLDHFNGSESWPLMKPGDMTLSNARLTPLRIEFDAMFPGPNGFGRPPLDSLTMFMDLVEQNFHSAPALWIQWLSRPPITRMASPALDALLVDRSTFRLLFRVAASAPLQWAGRYELVQAGPDELAQATVEEDGSAAAHKLAGTPNYFDFATYPFLFPLMKLEAGLGLRLWGYDYVEKKVEVLAIYVVGKVSTMDAHGKAHEVWRVDVMPPHRATLITFYVTSEAPYFYGWDYRVSGSGFTALKLTLRGWTPMESR